jgi:hypothetical protein
MQLMASEHEADTGRLKAIGTLGAQSAAEPSVSIDDGLVFSAS